MDLAIESTEGALVDDLATAEKQTDKLRFQASLLQALGQAVVATDTNNVIVFCNQAAEQLFGWAEKEMLKKNAEEAFKDVILENANEICTHTKARKPWTGEAMIKRQNGEFVATILATRPVFEEEKFCGVVGVFTDVSNLKWMQGVLEQAIKAVAELNEKLQVVDSLTRHDIRNKLAALKGRVYLLKKKHCSNQSAALPELVALEESFGQILNILEFQQFYMQLGSEELKEMDVEKSVTEAVELFSD
jgi:PAS domain S-box-containing protein